MRSRTWFRIIGLLLLCFSVIWPNVVVAAQLGIGQSNDSAEQGDIVMEDITDLRTLNSKTFRTSTPGQYRQVIYTNFVHYEGADTKLHEINTTIVDESELFSSKSVVTSEIVDEVEKVKEKWDKTKKSNSSIKDDETSFFAPQVPYKSVIPKNISNGYSIGFGENELTFIPQGTLRTKGKKGREADNVVHFENLWHSTTLTLSVLPNGIKEEIVLHDENAPDRFTFEVRGEIDEHLRSGSIYLLPAWLQDRNGVTRDVSMSERTVGNKTFIDLEWDGVGLEYPIIIDPTVMVSYNKSLYRCSDSGTGVNTVQLGLLVTIDVNQSCETYLIFNTDSIPKNAKINGATLGIYGNVWAVDGVNYDVTARLVTTPASVYESVISPPSYSMKNENRQSLGDTRGSKGNTFYWNIQPMVSETFRNGVMFIGLYPSTSEFGAFDSTFHYGVPQLTIYYETNTYSYLYDTNNQLAATRLSSGHLKRNQYDNNGNLKKSSIQYNLIENGDFSHGNNNWNIGSMMQISSEVAADNPASLKFHTTTTHSGSIISSSHPLLTGNNNQFTLSGYIRDNTTAGNVYITWKEYNYHFGEVNAGTKLLPTTKGTWEFKSISFVTQSVTQWITVEITADNGATGIAYFDSIKLSPGIINANFERGDSGWSDGIIMGIEHIPNNAHSGSYGIRYYYYRPSGSTMNTLQDIPVEPLKSYLYGSWVKNDLTADSKILISLNEYTGNKQFLKSTVLDASNTRGMGWDYTSIGFTTHSDTRFLNIEIKVENAQDSARLDDMNLTYLG